MNASIINRINKLFSGSIKPPTKITEIDNPYSNAYRYFSVELNGKNKIVQFYPPDNTIGMG